MSKSFREDLTGQRFGRLTVLEFVPNDKEHAYWKCRCDCGNEKSIMAGHLKRGEIRSCGCLHREKTKSYFTKHGDRGKRLYNIWKDMHRRCNSPRRNGYKNYGGRGICVTPIWNDYTKFREWALKNGYADNLSIDRIDVNGNYEPSNCRWTDIKTQNRNTRSNVIVEYQGEMMTLVEASECSGISYGALQTRHYKGERGKRLFRPVRNVRRGTMVEYHGEMVTFTEAAERSGIKRAT